MQMENFSQRGAESEAYLVKREAQDRRDESDEGYRLKGFRLKAGVRNSKHLTPIIHDSSSRNR